jgi:hypothetical protein
MAIIHLKSGLDLSPAESLLRLPPHTSSNAMATQTTGLGQCDRSPSQPFVKQATAKSNKHRIMEGS